MYWRFSRIRQNSTGSNERLQSCIALYDYEQNVMVINNIKLNISSNFDIPMINHFGFIFLAKFDFKLKILNMVFLNLNLNSKLINFNIKVNCFTKHIFLICCSFTYMIVFVIFIPHFLYHLQTFSFFVFIFYAEKLSRS